MPVEKQISKEEAKKRGLKFYYTGLPCKKGHISKIAVRNNECNECKKLWAKIYKQTDKYKEYLKKNKEMLYQGQRRWLKRNPEKENSYYEKRLKKGYFSKYIKQKSSKDEIFKLIHDCRVRITTFLKHKKMTKRNTTFKIIGCTPQELKSHIEKQFKKGMNWKNHSVHGWHIDHIIPLNSAKNEKEVLKLMHYSNLQPLWSADNWRKKDKILKN